MDEIVLVKELEVRVICKIHGEKVRNSSRGVVLGHGRLVVDMGKAYCESCGTSVWLTMKFEPMTTETVTKADYMKMLAAALAEEMPVEEGTDEEEDEGDQESVSNDNNPDRDSSSSVLRNPFLPGLIGRRK